MDPLEPALDRGLPAAVSPGASPRGRAAGLFLLLRPHHWPKNLLCLAGLVFSGRYLVREAVGAALGMTAVFCATSSAIYALNDLIDRDRDRLHPLKCTRPLAAGVISVPVARLLFVLLTSAALAGAAILGTPALVCVGTYLGLN